MREFESGAVRSNSNGKPEYYGYRHPAVERSFAEYMLKHQTQENGEQRPAYNWWGGWDKEVSLQSLVRHMEDLQALHAGMKVIKVKDDHEEKTHYLMEGETYHTDGNTIVEETTTEDCINACKFNLNAYLLELIKHRNGN